MYTIVATPVHCLAAGCTHAQPSDCFKRVPPFSLVKPNHVRRSSSSTSPSYNSLKPSTPWNKSRTFASPSWAPDVSRRLAKSRATGQKYRDNEQHRVFRLIIAIQNGRMENCLLFTVYSAHKRRRSSATPCVEGCAASYCSPSCAMGAASCTFWNKAAGRVEQHRFLYQRRYQCARTKQLGPLWFRGDEITEDCESGVHVLLHPLSNRCQRVLRQRFISGALATTLLEIILHRRNIVRTQADDSWDEDGDGFSSVETDGRRRKRSPFRKAVAESTMQSLMQLAIREFSREAGSHPDLADYVQRRMGNLSILMFHYDDAEAWCNAETDLVGDDGPLEDEMPDVEGWSCSGEVNGFGSWDVTLREGPRRCTRCGVLKVSGSGHGRSKCMDGLGVASTVPFEEAPSWTPSSVKWTQFV
ncbi:hypothetical protein BWQ96_02557 [Gracilariopsis chorda]|uniref:Uncharacterized protein n=1 Tax=Gracilariopsis chorda TaxID=448386 RepID=A0A2V3J040_9FLOR|nr:hypothetical protein BWQ96_02557 [Gracilariopsis chorda]|eukprot:PXF47695.1 hypothetical protein BWQ96_02557 [Gracilariopsis chorda]